MDSDLAMVHVVGFLQDHAAGIQSQEAAFNLFQVLDLKADVMETAVHFHFVQRRALLEESQVIEAVGDGDISFWRAAQFFSSQEALIEIDKLCRVLADEGDVAEGGHS